MSPLNILAFFSASVEFKGSTAFKKNVIYCSAGGHMVDSCWKPWDWYAWGIYYAYSPGAEKILAQTHILSLPAVIVPTT